jgi:hypothetical protein
MHSGRICAIVISIEFYQKSADCFKSSPKFHCDSIVEKVLEELASTIEIRHNLCQNLFGREKY